MCFDCLISKILGGKQKGYLHPIKSGRGSFSLIHMDHLVKSSQRNQDLPVIIDSFTKFTRLFPVKDTSAPCVMKAIKEFVNEYGLPDKITSYREAHVLLLINLSNIVKKMEYIML